MTKKAKAEKNQRAYDQDDRHSSRELFLSWIATLLLATGGAARAATVNVDVGGPGGPFFDPDNITISAGDTVLWTWRDESKGHSVTSGANGTPDGLFDSGVHLPPLTFSYTFPTPGTFEYFCTPHYSMGMVGTVHVMESTGSSTFGNISTRLNVDTGDSALIGGFIVTGAQPKKIIVRAIGPSLSSFFPDALADPTLELHNSSGGLISSNDNWRTTQEQEIMATGVAPSNDLESAIVATVPANTSNYTAIVRGVNNQTGIGVVEAYDLDRTVDSKLANISTRGLVQTGANVLIGGLIVLGQDPLRVIVRAIGPSLPIPAVLADPTLELHDGNGALIASNDNWRSDQETEIIATGIPPTNDAESAIVRNLTPGNYTAIVQGVNNTTGIAVVEAYNLN